MYSTLKRIDSPVPLIYSHHDCKHPDAINHQTQPAKTDLC